MEKIVKWITIVVLCYNEEERILSCLRNIQGLEGLEGADIIVSDGNSTDQTKNLISDEIVLIDSEPNKSSQMNKALDILKTEIVWFIHADMELPKNSLLLIKKYIDEGYDGGGFRNEFDKFNERIKRIGMVLNFRFFSKKEQSDKGIFYGDNGIFIKNAILQKMGGVPEQEIMEDYELSVRLKKADVQMVKINEVPIIVSARRHIESGFIKTRMLWIIIRILYKWGVSPKKLRNLYLDNR